MNSFQKTIKYVAIGLAIFLSIGIISGIGAIGYGIYRVVNNKSTVSDTVTVSDISEFDTYFIENSQNGQTFMSSYNPRDIDSIYITSNTSEIFIQSGDILQVDAYNINNDNFQSFVDGDSLIIDNSSEFSDIFPFCSEEAASPVIILTLPSNFHAEEIYIENDTGTLLVESINTDYLYLFTGTSETTFLNSTAKEVVIEGGVGYSVFEECNFTDLNMNCGVGNTQFSGKLSGNCYVDGGVGRIEFYLRNSYRDFEINLSTDFGETAINGKKYHSDTLLNEDAPNELIVSSGVGSISINFED